ncbi:MAG: hypothetical protein Q8O67_34205 [Deltaproteobacteria bacterium]|nr:hypothetical protein [Deltaproteobacteria bacterium]
MAFVLVGGCSSPNLVVEVLPPRTSVTCAAPTKADPALGRGLLDVTATLGTHGSYVADLRLSLSGQDARITGVSVGYEVPEGSPNIIKDAAENAGGDVVVGDVLLAGEGDDLRVAVLENVELVPRELALAFQDDSDLELSAIEFARLGVTITPILDGTAATAVSSGFAIDLCKGCLVTPPVACNDDGEFTLNPVACRPGQDAPLFLCKAAP